VSRGKVQNFPLHYILISWKNNIKNARLTVRHLLVEAQFFYRSA